MAVKKTDELERDYSVGADASLMSDEDYAAVRSYGDQYNAAREAGNQAGMQAAHDAAEALRAKYSYSGGGDGSQYIKLPQDLGAKDFSYESAPAYVNKYQSQIDQLAGQILNREKFSYDPETDPLYQQYADSYTRNGQRAMQDTLGQLSARTGGLASSYAGTASQQTYDNYMAALADKVPELQQLAYSMYRDEGNDQRANLEMLMALEQGDYAKYADLLGQYNEDRSFDYGVFADDRSFDYGLSRDKTEDARYADETAWNRQTYQDETAYSRSLQKAQTLAAAGDFSGYKALGYTDAEIANMKASYDAAQMLAAKKGDYSGSNPSEGTEDWDGLFEAAMNSTSPQNFISSNYKKYGFTSSSGLWNSYQEWAGNQYDSLNYNEDEGVFTWNGKNYSDPEKLFSDINGAFLTPSQQEALMRKFSMFGFDLN